MRIIKLLSFLLEHGDINAVSKSEEYQPSNIKDTLLHKIHPKQIISDLHISATLYKTTYEYTTNRGNTKQGEKYFIFQKLNPQINMKDELLKWIDKFNKDNKHRQLLNVKFLSSECLGFIKL